MSNAEAVLAAIEQSAVIAIIRTNDAAAAIQAGIRLQQNGLDVIEVSLSTPGALSAVAHLAREFPAITIGVGTVLKTADVARSADAGAQFVLSPVCDPEVIDTAHRSDLAVIPGCATPTDMHNATRTGAQAVKIFPASLWSPDSLSDLLVALPGLRCVPTGGVDLDSAGTWLEAGAFAVGLGSSLRSATGPAQAHALARTSVAGQKGL